MKLTFEIFAVFMTQWNLRKLLDSWGYYLAGVVDVTTICQMEWRLELQQQTNTKVSSRSNSEKLPAPADVSRELGFKKWATKTKRYYKSPVKLSPSLQFLIWFQYGIGISNCILHIKSRWLTKKSVGIGGDDEVFHSDNDEVYLDDYYCCYGGASYNLQGVQANFHLHIKITIFW